MNLAHLDLECGRNAWFAALPVPLFLTRGNRIAAQESKLRDCEVSLSTINMDMVTQVIVSFWNR
jgi:hypothetical protein